jgi:hypothetical protein
MPKKLGFMRFFKTLSKTIFLSKTLAIHNGDAIMVSETNKSTSKERRTKK